MTNYRCRWNGSVRNFIDSCRPDAVERLVKTLAPPGAHDPEDWDSKGESASWAKSLPRLANVLERAGLDKCYVILEYNPWQMGSARVDVIVAGESPSGEVSYVVIELKQWSSCVFDPTDGMVHGTGAAYERPEGLQDPLDQARRYETFIRNYTAGMDGGGVADPSVTFHSVAFLHNATRKSIETLLSASWETGRSVFAGDAEGEANLADALGTWLSPLVNGHEAGMMLLEAGYHQAPELLKVAGKILTDPVQYPLSDQQNVFFNAVQHQVQLALAPTADRGGAIIVITGGPGTGKTWIAMHLLGVNARMKRQVAYATLSTSLRAALSQRIRGVSKSLDRPVDGLITSARTYWDEADWDTPRDIIVVDEAHRVAHWTVRTGHNNRKDIQAHLEAKDVTQLFELKKSAKVLVLFIDEDQSITPDDYCRVEGIRKLAERTGSSFEQYELTEQHRSGGSEAYEQWVDDLVAGRPSVWRDEQNFSVRLADTPEELEKLTFEPTAPGAGNNPRLLAGFCWTWEKWPDNPDSIEDVPNDIRIGNWKKRWNLRKPIDGFPEHSSWASKPKGAAQVGSVFTSLGFEFGRCGVLIGPDFRWVPDRNEWVIDVTEMRYDKLIRKAKNSPGVADLIRNHYRVLLSRSMSSTVIHSTDPATRTKLAEYVNPPTDT